MPETRLAAAAVVAVGAVGGLAFANGGYFPTEWGWASIVFLLVALSATIARERLLVGRLGVGLVAGLVLFDLWTALSALWGPDPTPALLETQRVFVYVAAAAAFLVVAHGGGATGLAAGTTAASVLLALYALGSHLFPDRATYDPTAGYQIDEPLDYSNALAILLVIGLLLALGFAGRAARSGARAAAGAAAVVLAVGLYLTFSRGAILALAVGAIAVTALEPRRLGLGVRLAPLGAILLLAVWVASRHDALTHEGYSFDDASSAGRRLALALAVLAVLGGAAAAFAPQVAVPASRERTFALALAAAGVVLVLGAATQVGKAIEAFDSRPAATGGDLNKRLLSVSSDWRSDYWRVAWREVRAEPLLGGGAGSWERWWLRERPSDITVRNAHNLYLETLAELGPVGLVLLVGTLLLPLAGALGARERPFVPAAAGAYAAFLAHAAVDWDWQITAVGVAALACAASVLSGHPVEVPARVRVALGLAAVPLLGLALAAKAGNSAVAASRTAFDRLDLAEARAQARRARRWQPWSAEPLRLLAAAQLADGDVEAAQQTLREATRRDPENWELWYDLAAAGEGSARRTALEQAARLNPHAAALRELREAERKV
jgi:hypothetical protein